MIMNSGTKTGCQTRMWAPGTRIGGAGTTTGWTWIGRAGTRLGTRIGGAGTTTGWTWIGRAGTTTGWTWIGRAGTTTGWTWIGRAGTTTRRELDCGRPELV